MVDKPQTTKGWAIFEKGKIPCWTSNTFERVYGDRYWIYPTKKYASYVAKALAGNFSVKRVTIKVVK